MNKYNKINIYVKINVMKDTLNKKMNVYQFVAKNIHFIYQKKENVLKIVQTIHFIKNMNIMQEVKYMMYTYVH